MAVTAEQLNIIFTARDREFSRSIDRMTKKIRRFETTSTRGLSRTSRTFSNLGRTAKTAGPVLASAIPAAAPIAASASAVLLLSSAFTSAVQNGDRLRLLEGRIEAITGSAAQAKSGVAGLAEIAFETGSSIDGAASAFTRFTQASKSIGATQEQTLQLTDTMLKLGRIGGGTEQELTSGAIQMSQALASGQLRGDELRSVMENLPLVSEALAESLGVNIGQLREMAEEGELTSRRVFDALLSKSEETNQRFKQLPLTLEVASGRMSAAWGMFTAGIDESLGLSERLAGVLDGIADRLERASAKGIRGIDVQIEDAEKRLAALQRGEVPSRRIGTTDTPGKIEARIQDLEKERAALVKFAADKEAAEARVSAASALSASKTGAELFRNNQLRERELALMADKERAILKAQDAAEASLRQRAPLVTDQDVERARNFAKQTVLMQQARAKSGKASVDQEAEFYSVMEGQLEVLRIRDALVGKTASQQAEILTRERLISEARRRNIPINEDIQFQIEQQAETVGELTALVVKAEEAEKKRAEAIRASKKEADSLRDASQKANENLASGLTRAALQADSLGDALKKVGLQLIEIAATGFITGAVSGKTGGGSFVSNLFSSAGASLFSGGGSLPGSAGASGSLRVVPGATGFSQGGPVTGKGSGTSDSIPARLSNGEFVINAAAARMNRPTLEAINSGRSISPASQQSVHVSVSAGPEFDVMVEQSAAPVAERAVARNNQRRDSTFNGRVMAANAEREKDFR